MPSNILPLTAFSLITVGILAIAGLLPPLLATALALIIAAIYIFQTAPRALTRLIIITSTIIGISLISRFLPLSSTLRLAIGLILATTTLSLLLPRPEQTRQIKQQP